MWEALQVVLIIGSTGAGAATSVFLIHRAPRIIAWLQRGMARVQWAIARHRERRRYARLDPLSQKLEWNHSRHEQDRAEWMEKWNALDPAPEHHQYQAQARREYLFSGEKHLIRRAIAMYGEPPKPDGSAARPYPVRQPIEPKDQLVRTGNGQVMRVRGDDIVEIRNMAGEVIVSF